MSDLLRDVTIRVVITEEDLRNALIGALNGERVSPDLAWAILRRWDRAANSQPQPGKPE